MSGGPMFYSRSACFVYGLSEKLRGVANWMERRYRILKRIDMTRTPSENGVKVHMPGR